MLDSFASSSFELQKNLARALEEHKKRLKSEQENLKEERERLLKQCQKKSEALDDLLTLGQLEQINRKSEEKYDYLTAVYYLDMTESAPAETVVRFLKSAGWGRVTAKKWVSELVPKCVSRVLIQSNQHQLAGAVAAKLNNGGPLCGFSPEAFWIKDQQPEDLRIMLFPER